MTDSDSLPEAKANHLASDFQKIVDDLRETVGGGNTGAISDAAGAVYVRLLDRAAAISSRLDQARREGSQAKDLGAARLALRDERSVFDLADRALRGLYASLAMRLRLWFELSAKARGIDDSETASEELRKLRVNYLFFQTFYEKARLYGLPMIPLQPLRDVMLEVQRRKAAKEQMEDSDQRAVTKIVEYLEREVEQMSKSVADQVAKEKLQTSNQDQSRESAEGGSDA